MEDFTIRLKWSDFEEMLIARLQDWGDRHTLPECVWNYVIEQIKKRKGLPIAYNTPYYIVDNLIANSDYRSFAEYAKFHGITSDTASIMEHLQGRYLAIFPEQQYILFNTGLDRELGINTD